MVGWHFRRRSILPRGSRRQSFSSTNEDRSPTSHAIVSFTKEPPLRPIFRACSSSTICYFREPEENGERHRRKSGRRDKTNGMVTVYSRARRRKRYVSGVRAPCFTFLAQSLSNTEGHRGRELPCTFCGSWLEGFFIFSINFAQKTHR